MRPTLSLATFNQKIKRHCKKLLIKITRSCPRRQYRHLKLQKATSSSPSSSSSGNQVTRVFASFFLSFQKKKKMNRLNELRSFSDAVCERKASNPESKKKVFPTGLALPCLGQGKAHSQDYDAPRDSTSVFLPFNDSKVKNNSRSSYVLLST